MITSFKTYIQSILIWKIFEKDIKLSRKNTIVWYDTYDKYGWSCDHQCGDTKDK